MRVGVEMLLDEEGRSDEVEMRAKKLEVDWLARC